MNQSVNSPVWWAKRGAIGIFVARRLSPARRPLLILSLPRSGSSWVGEIMGSVAAALYLREPLTQSHLAHGGKYSVFPVDSRSPPVDYQRFGDAALAALPLFGANIVRKPRQWALLSRPHRRAVIKEVNPLACSWLIERYRPQIVFLVRHPAAVAQSYWELEWRGIEEQLRVITQGLIDGPLHPWRTHLCSASGFWAAHGAFQGMATHMALNALRDYPDHKLIRYEDLCQEPITMFKDLFGYAGFEWDAEIERLIVARSSGAASQTQHAYSTARDSRQMTAAWKRKVSAADLRELVHGYRAFDLPFYTSPEEWNLESVA